MTAVELTVSGPPRLLTSNLRLHWATRALLTRQWRESAHWCAKAAGLPRGLDRVHIVVTVHPAKGGRLRDVGNVSVKAVIDGIVDYGLIPDDDDAHLVGPDLRRGANLLVPSPSLRLWIVPLDGAA